MKKIMMGRSILYARLILFLILLILVLSSSSCSARRKSSHHIHSRKKPKNTSNRRDHQNNSQHHQVLLNIDDFGANPGNGSDNSRAFQKAWKKACSSMNVTTLLVPKNKIYFIKNVNFTGPCNNFISMQIEGTIKATSQMYDIPKRLWIKFEDVTNMNLFGGGTIDGNGQIWWNNSCKIKKTKPCQTQSAPAALTFKNCTNLKMSNINMQNAQQMHVVFEDCHDVEASSLRVTAPEHSPNTDGIHITRTQNINIMNSIIKTGDDCISIVNGSNNVQVKNIMCGPGHGISIGSLGENNSENHVSNIVVKGVKFTGTTNGVRIKTWEGGSGIARNIQYEDIEMRNVSNPIIINQHYCDKNIKCVKQKSGVQVENIIYRNIRGTSASKIAISFNCSESVPCRNLILENVKLINKSRKEEEEEKAEAVCSQLSMLSVDNTSFPRCSKKI